MKPARLVELTRQHASELVAVRGELSPRSTCRQEIVQDDQAPNEPE
jgi:hypothetical protein